MMKLPLHEGWTVRAVGDTAPLPPNVRAALVEAGIPATVPGCIHTDLLAADLIADPYLDINEPKVQWIGDTDFAYTCRFDVDPQALEQQRIDLVCDGLDTVASIELNGQTVASTANMHVRYRFDVKPLLRPTGNELRITFASAVRYARHWEQQLGTLPWLNTPAPFNFIRKMACNFGWDWGPTLVTCGIWRDIRLEAWTGSRIDSVRPLIASANTSHARVDLHIDLATADARADADADADTVAAIDLGYTLYGPQGQRIACSPIEGKPGHNHTRLHIDNPRLWWPRGHGDQPLYCLHVELRDGEGNTIDHWEGRLGLREVTLDTEPDDVGRRFAVQVNGKPIFCMGANWVPDDCFLNRACQPQRYRQRIEQAADANMNMLRIWGGGIYETDAFYDICDELGVMVWQDFLFACAAYPEEEPFHSLVAEEVTDNVKRLAAHPSLVIWNGCNENIWGYHAWGWKEKGKVEGRTWGLGYYHHLIPSILTELDPSRPYWPASPYSHPQGSPEQHDDPKGEVVHPNAETHGNKHVWEAWFGEEYRVYRSIKPRFCSEFGFQAPATWATMAAAIGPSQLQVGSAALKAHQKSPHGDRNNDRHLISFFDMPAGFDDWHYLLQVNQARALSTGVEWFRSLQPHCMGTIYWQLNDCWPVTSWSAIDSGGRRKPMWYATRAFFAQRLVTIQPSDDGLAVFLCNDTDEPWIGNLAIMRMDFIGRPQFAARAPVHAAPRTVQRVDLSAHPQLITADEPTRQVLVASCDALHSFWYFDVDKNLAYEKPDLQADLQREGDFTRLTLTSDVLLRDVCIFVDRLDPEATIDHQFVTLMPQEPFTFTIHTTRELDREALTSPPVLQHATRFGKA